MGDPVAHARVVALVGSFGSDGLQCGPLASLENVLSLVAIIFSVFFAIFVGSMASDQVRALGRGACTLVFARDVHLCVSVGGDCNEHDWYRSVEDVG